MSDVLEVYCPMCGGWVDVKVADKQQLSPGEIKWVCPECKTKWRIKVEFYEAETS